MELIRFSYVGVLHDLATDVQHPGLHVEVRRLDPDREGRVYPVGGCRASRRLGGDSSYG